MAAGKTAQVARFELHGTTVDATVTGSGRPILFLHAGLWLASDRGFVDALAELGQVMAPLHPGFATGEPPAHLASADDLAYVYLDLLEAMKAEDTLVVGASFGAFVAAQMAVKNSRRIGELVLIAPVGLRPGKRDERDYADVFATDEPDLLRLAFADPARFQISPREIPEEELAVRVRAREALSRYIWQPYMHDPRLKHKLHRVAARTLVLWGAKDRIARKACAEAYAQGIPIAKLDTIDDTGHFPHVEQPTAVLSAIRAFASPLPLEAAAKTSKPKGAR